MRGYLALIVGGHAEAEGQPVGGVLDRLHLAGVAPGRPNHVEWPVVDVNGDRLPGSASTPIRLTMVPRSMMRLTRIRNGFIGTSKVGRDVKKSAAWLARDALLMPTGATAGNDAICEGRSGR